MMKFFKISGMIAWLYLIYLYRESIPNQVSFYARNGLIFCGFIFIVYVIFKLLKYDKLKVLGNLMFGSELSNAINEFLSNLPNPSNKIKSDVIAQLIIRFTRIGIITLALASVTTFLLFKQNQLLEIQNSRITQQLFLQEADRRSSLVYLFSDLMKAINLELSNDYLRNERRDLSPQLLGRIISITSRLKPYRYLENGEL